MSLCSPTANSLVLHSAKNTLSPYLAPEGPRDLAQLSSPACLLALCARLLPSMHTAFCSLTSPAPSLPSLSSSSAEPQSAPSCCPCCFALKASDYSLYLQTFSRNYHPPQILQGQEPVYVFTTDPTSNIVPAIY